MCGRTNIPRPKVVGVVHHRTGGLHLQSFFMIIDTNQNIFDFFLQNLFYLIQVFFSNFHILLILFFIFYIARKFLLLLSFQKIFK